MATRKGVLVIAGFFASPDLSKGEEVLRKFMAMPDRA
jgi:hypothetical protein